MFLDDEEREVADLIFSNSFLHPSYFSGHDSVIIKRFEGLGLINVTKDGITPTQKLIETYHG